MEAQFTSLPTIEEEEKNGPLSGNELQMGNEETSKLSPLRTTENQKDEWVSNFLKMPNKSTVEDKSRRP